MFRPMQGNADSGIGNVLLVESEILGFEIQNSASKGIKNAVLDYLGWGENVN